VRQRAALLAAADCRGRRWYARGGRGRSGTSGLTVPKMTVPKMQWERCAGLQAPVLVQAVQLQHWSKSALQIAVCSS